ncbi:MULTISPECIES: hypothetical protein [unclassified Ornithinimicrobium]|uniref:hypothetical protein n=1 Tax=unclassified Ornithinimicrobium TaxID=2615080 RepID=UPI0038620FAA
MTEFADDRGPAWTLLRGDAGVFLDHADVVTVDAGPGASMRFTGAGLELKDRGLTEIVEWSAIESLSVDVPGPVPALDPLRAALTIISPTPLNIPRRVTVRGWVAGEWRRWQLGRPRRTSSRFLGLAAPITIIVATLQEAQLPFQRLADREFVAAQLDDLARLPYLRRFSRGHKYL